MTEMTAAEQAAAARAQLRELVRRGVTQMTQMAAKAEQAARIDGEPVLRPVPVSTSV